MKQALPLEERLEYNAVGKVKKQADTAGRETGLSRILGRTGK
jgi:hypothetical protein